MTTLIAFHGATEAKRRRATSLLETVPNRNYNRVASMFPIKAFLADITGTALKNVDYDAIPDKVTEHLEEFALDAMPIRCKFLKVVLTDDMTEENVAYLHEQGRMRVISIDLDNDFSMKERPSLVMDLLEYVDGRLEEN